jgi:hypothetical protein
MTTRRRILVLLDCPADLRPSLGRLLKALGRRYRVRCVDYREVGPACRLADFAIEPKSEIAQKRNTTEASPNRTENR